MLRSMLKFILSQSYLVTMAVAVLCGMFIPHAHDLTQWNTVYLQIIFFMSCLKLDMRSYVEYVKEVSSHPNYDAALNALKGKAAAAR